MNEFNRMARTGFAFGAGLLLALGIGGLAAVTVTGTFKTFSSGELVSAAEINQNFDALKTAVEQADPPGSVTAFAGASVPAGWLLCDGQAVSRATYADLYTAIGDRYGAGDGSTTFNVPDLRGEFIRGFDDGRGIDTGRVLGTNQTDQMQSHNHTDSGHTHTYTQNVFGWGASFTNGTVDASSTGNTGAGTANLGDPTDSGTGAGTPRHGNETRPRNVALNYIIKY